MPTTAWKPEYTARAQDVWERYERDHDLTTQRGKVAGIDPETVRIWIGESGVEVAEQMEAEEVEAPVYLIRIGLRLLRADLLTVS